MLFAPELARPGEVIITPTTEQSLGVAAYRASMTGWAAAAWPAANLVIFVPFYVPEPVTVTKLFAAIGVASGNIDLGIYAEDGTRLVSKGTTAAAGATDLQVLDVTDTVLARGTYYMAMVCDTVTTLTVLSVAPAAGILQAFGLLEQAGITMPLSTGASPATFAKYTRAYLPMMGVQGYRTFGP